MRRSLSTLYTILFVSASEKLLHYGKKVWMKLFWSSFLLFDYFSHFTHFIVRVRAEFYPNPVAALKMLVEHIFSVLLLMLLCMLRLVRTSKREKLHNEWRISKRKKKWEWMCGLHISTTLIVIALAVAQITDVLIVSKKRFDPSKNLPQQVLSAIENRVYRRKWLKQNLGAHAPLRLNNNNKNQNNFKLWAWKYTSKIVSWFTNFNIFSQFFFSPLFYSIFFSRMK